MKEAVSLAIHQKALDDFNSLKKKYVSLQQRLTEVEDDRREVHHFGLRLAMRCEKLETLSRRAIRELTDERTLLQSALHEMAVSAGVEPRRFRSDWLHDHHADHQGLELKREKARR